MVETEHTAVSVECTHKVNGEALERHLFSKGNYPDNIWPVVVGRARTGIPVCCLKEVNKLEQSWI